jgi:F420-dependent oxidoreductase-like protein
MKLGSMVGQRGSPEGFARQLRRLDDAGIDYLFAGEAYTADAVSTLGFMAANTQRAHIGSSILPIYTRTPSLLAMTAVGIDQLSGGRMVLGIGASGPQVVEGFHGLPYDYPLGRTREIIDICRQVWARQAPLEHVGAHYSIPLATGGTGLGKPLKIINHPVRDRIPIYLASLGPKNVELTAELAEGWLPLLFWPDRAREVWGASLAAGAAKRSADLPALEVVAGGALAIGDDVEALREVARPMLALYFGGMGSRDRNYYNDVLRRYGFEAEASEIQEHYLAGRKREAAALVPEVFLEQMSLIGDEGYVKERVMAYQAAGVTILTVNPVGPNGLADVEKVRAWLS